MADFHERQAVAVSLKDLANSSVPFETLEAAFGPSSLGILIVKDLPTQYAELRHRLLSYASYLANLPTEELDGIACPGAKYLTGWSHGKEALKSGVYDTLKGSYYVNCDFYNEDNHEPEIPEPTALNETFPEFTHDNVWPRASSLPGFREAFQDLCRIIIDTAVLVAKACDRYAEAHIGQSYERGYLERVVRTSVTTKARLLHYFPPNLPEPSPSLNGSHQVEPKTEDKPQDKIARDNEANNENSDDSNNNKEEDDDDSWCATHIDHGCLTGLTSAIYIDESAHPPTLPPQTNNLPSSSSLPPLPITNPPDPKTGLYIHARDSQVTKVSIPSDCLGFQTGEALQRITNGKFRAVPHFVRAGGNGGEGEGRNEPRKERSAVARNTLAVFTQPNLNEVVDRETGLTFGQFSREVVGRFG